jgi:hypothetical protein
MMTREEFVAAMKKAADPYDVSVVKWWFAVYPNGCDRN